MNDTGTLNNFLSIQQAASLTHYSPQWVRTLCKKGKIQFVFTAGRYFIPVDQILSYKSSPKPKGGRGKKAH